MQGNQEEETESQQPRVSHPSEAGRRIKEPGGKQKVNNKESLTPESYLSVCLSIYLPKNPWDHGKTERQQQEKSLKKP